MSQKLPRNLSRLPRLCAAALLAGALSAGAASGLGDSADASSRANDAIRVGDIAPGFTLPTTDGDSLELAHSSGGKPTLIVFWSYFCFPCQKEIPELQQVHEDLGEEQLRLIGVNLDGPSFQGKVRPFLAKNGITFPTVYDNLTESFFEVAEKFGVVGTPTSFLMGPQGRVRLIQLGRLDQDTLKGLVLNAKGQAYCGEITKSQQ